jgi:hypothetical protein
MANRPARIVADKKLALSTREKEKPLGVLKNAQGD